MHIYIYDNQDKQQPYQPVRNVGTLDIDSPEESMKGGAFNLEGSIIALRTNGGHYLSAKKYRWLGDTAILDATGTNVGDRQIRSSSISVTFALNLVPSLSPTMYSPFIFICVYIHLRDFTWHTAWVGGLEPHPQSVDAQVVIRFLNSRDQARLVSLGREAGKPGSSIHEREDYRPLVDPN